MVLPRSGMIETMVATYQERLAEAMRDAGYDVAKLARELGLSYQAVKKVADGRSRSFSAQNNDVAARVLGVLPSWLASGTGPKRSVVSDLTVEYGVFGKTSPELEPAGEPRKARPVPVVGTARLGTNGYYDELQYPAGHGDGTIDSYSPDGQAYALRVKGDSMHPAIRNGSFIVAEPSRACVPGEYVVLVLRAGQKMVKELVIERTDEIVVESVNGGERLTIEKSGIEKMHPVGAIVSASKWRPA